MAIYRQTGSCVYWMDFFFAGQRIRESTGTRSKKLAGDIAKNRRYDLEAGAAGVRSRRAPRILAVAAGEWLALKRASIAPRTWQIEKTNLGHLLPVLGKLLVCDIEAQDVAEYQQVRLAEGASPKTVNLELGTLRAILKRSGAWARIQPEIRMLPVNNNVGRAITAEEEAALLRACGESRSRSLLAFVTLALATGARFNVIRTLTWQQVDLERGVICWGKDKTAAGSGNMVPLNTRALAALRFWAGHFPDRRPDHFVFSRERYGGSGQRGPAGSRQAAHFVGGHAYATDPTRPVGDIKEAWEAAKKRAGLRCRFHDLRHTAASRMLAASVVLPIVAKILGWSPSTAVRMAARYGHFSESQLRSAVEATTLNVRPDLDRGPHDFPHSRGEQNRGNNAN